MGEKIVWPFYSGIYINTRNILDFKTEATAMFGWMSVETGPVNDSDR
jgi:hypothetical protein